MPPVLKIDGWDEDLVVLRWQQFARDSALVDHEWSYLDRDIGWYRLVSSGYWLGFREDSTTDPGRRAVQGCNCEDSGRYPSGHATWYVITSLLLAARVTCGMHDPSDGPAGQRLGEAAVK